MCTSLFKKKNGLNLSPLKMVMSEERGCKLEHVMVFFPLVFFHGFDLYLERACLFYFWFSLLEREVMKFFLDVLWVCVLCGNRSMSPSHELSIVNKSQMIVMDRSDKQ